MATTREREPGKGTSKLVFLPQCFHGPAAHPNGSGEGARESRGARFLGRDEVPFSRPIRLVAAERVEDLEPGNEL